MKRILALTFGMLLSASIAFAQNPVTVEQLGTTIDKGNGTTSSQTQRVTISSDSTGQVACTNCGLTDTDDGTIAGAQVTSLQIAASYMWNGSNWIRMVGSASGLLVDTELPAASPLSDGMSNPTTPLIGAAMLTFNGSTWDRAQLATDNSQGSTTSGQKGPLVQGAVTTSAPTYTTGTTNPLSIQTDGDLRVECSNCPAITSFPDNEPFNLAQVAGTTVSTGVGASGAGTLRTATVIHDGTDTALVSGSGSLQVTCDNCGGSTPFEDNDAFTAGTSSVSNVGFVVDDTATTAVTENSAGAARMSTNRNVYTTIRDGAGNERGANVNASNQLEVAAAVTQATASNLNAQVVGNIAHDSPDSGNPLKIGGKAISLGSTPTEAADGDRTDNYATRAGVLFVQPGHYNTITRECQVNDADGAQTGTACVSVSAGTRIVVMGVDASCSNANSVNVNIRVAFSTSTTMPTAAVGGVNGVLLRHPGVPPGGGISKGFAGATVGIGADDEDVRFTMDDPVSGSCTITLDYYPIVG